MVHNNLSLYGLPFFMKITNEKLDATFYDHCHLFSSEDKLVRNNRIYIPGMDSASEIT